MHRKQKKMHVNKSIMAYSMCTAVYGYMPQELNYPGTPVHGTTTSGRYLLPRIPFPIPSLLNSREPCVSRPKYVDATLRIFALCIDLSVCRLYRTKPPRYEYECAHTCFTFYLNLELSLALGLNFPSPFGLPMLRRLFGKVVI